MDSVWLEIKGAKWMDSARRETAWEGNELGRSECPWEPRGQYKGPRSERSLMGHEASREDPGAEEGFVGGRAYLYLHVLLLQGARKHANIQLPCTVTQNEISYYSTVC